MITVLRREEKYPLDLIYAKSHINRFEKVLQLDDYSKEGTYRVRSLYFDTFDDKDFFDKLREQNIRRKIRLRIYNPTDKVAKLELKQKENIFQKKRSLIVSREHAQEIIKGNYEVLLGYDEEFAAEMYSIMRSEGYRPKSMVEYERRAFVAKENNIRLSFDSNIRATETNFDLFSENLLLYPIFPQDKVILEVKYDKFLLSYISQLISAANTTRMSSSKYCLSRSLGYPNHI